MRILLDPDATESGGGAAREAPVDRAPEQPQQQATQQQKKAPDQQAQAKPDEPEKPSTVTLTPAEFERLRGIERENKELREADRKRQDAEAKAEEERLRNEGKLQELLAKREKDLADRDVKIRENEARTKNSERSRELALALSGHDLVPGAAAQLTRLLKDEMEVVPDGEGWRVQSHTGKPAADYVREQLTTAEYAHFLKADRRGGSGATGKGQQPAPPPEPTDPEKQLIEQLKASYKNSHGNVPVALAGHHRFGNQDHN